MIVKCTGLRRSWVSKMEVNYLFFRNHLFQSSISLTRCCVCVSIRLAHERCGCNILSITLSIMWRIDSWVFHLILHSSEWQRTPLMIANIGSIGWCRQATSHYRRQCSPTVCHHMTPLGRNESNWNFAKFRVSLTSIIMDGVLCHFAQEVAVCIPCCVKNIRQIHRQKKTSHENRHLMVFQFKTDFEKIMLFRVPSILVCAWITGVGVVSEENVVVVWL